MDSDRCAVVKLFQAGYKPKEISKWLKMPRGKRMFVIRTIKRFQETGNVDDWARTGRPCSVVNPNLRKMVREQIRRNPRRSMRKMASVLKISLQSSKEPLKIIRDEIMQKKESAFPY